MMATAREAWQFTPNVISHFEKEAEHFLLEDKQRKEKLRQLKVGHFFKLMFLNTSIGPSDQ